jgi:hypothetical protein
MKQFIKKVFGIDKIEAETAEATRLKIEADAAAAISIKEAADAKEKERLAKLSPKELATENNEPWVQVLETHVNKENVRHGFFELDWNDLFVLQLRDAGYTGVSSEDIVDQWFSELCRNVGADENIDMRWRGSGYVNRALRDDGKTEIS